jgi:hypothetical protein
LRGVPQVPFGIAFRAVFRNYRPPCNIPPRFPLSFIDIRRFRRSAAIPRYGPHPARDRFSPYLTGWFLTPAATQCGQSRHTLYFSGTERCAMSLKTNLIDILVSPPIRWINFTYANRMIAPMGYYYVASALHNGTIKCSINSKLGHTAAYDPATNTVIASSHDYGLTYIDEKSLLVHEATHALLDTCYNGRDMNGSKSSGITVLKDETIAYLAQAMYIIAAKGVAPSDRSSPDYHAYVAVKPKLESLMSKPWTGCETIAFSETDVTALQSSIRSHEFYRSSYSSMALHNG